MLGMSCGAGIGIGSSIAEPKRTRKKARKPPNRRSSSTRRNLSVLRKLTVEKLRPTKALIIKEDSTVTEACRRMASSHLDAVLLTNSDCVLCGIFTDKDLVTRVIAEGLNPEETYVSTVMTRNPIYVSSDTLADDALRKMMRGKFRHLPVVENGQVVTLLNMKKCLYDAIVHLEWETEKGNATVAAFKELQSHWENMRTATSSTSIEALRGQTFQLTLSSLLMRDFKATTVSPNDTVATATKKMLEHKSDYVIITVGCKPQGIFTSKDLLMRVVSRSLPPDSTMIEKVMTTNIECAALDTTVVDALHIMHDGHFFHLPIVDRDKHIVGCIGILELMEGGFASAEKNMEESSNAKVSDSTPTCYEDDERHSDVSARLTSEVFAAEAARTIYPSLWLTNFFSFKVEDPKGCVHRFNCGTQSLEELVSAIALRIGNEHGCPQILYKDDEGDLILLSSDSDLALAVGLAKAFGMKVLRLYVDYPNKMGGEGTSWRTLHTTVIASILVIVGLGILFHARRSSKEPWRVMWNRLLTRSMPPLRLA